MADAGPQNKDRYWAFKRQLLDKELAILGLTRDLRSHEGEAEICKAKIEDLTKELGEIRKQIDLYSRE